jgi:hypothetical protein
VRWSAPPLAEWGCELKQIHSWRGAGVAVERHWLGREKRDEERYFVVAEVRVPAEFRGVEIAGEAPAGLGWHGACHIDEHADGTRSLFWRVRALDGDARSGELRAQLKSLEFRLVGP